LAITPISEVTNCEGAKVSYAKFCFSLSLVLVASSSLFAAQDSRRETNRGKPTRIEYINDQNFGGRGFSVRMPRAKDLDASELFFFCKELKQSDDEINRIIGMIYKAAENKWELEIKVEDPGRRFNNCIRDVALNFR
jgi:hypothetical protein